MGFSAVAPGLKSTGSVVVVCRLSRSVAWGWGREGKGGWYSPSWRGLGKGRELWRDTVLPSGSPSLKVETELSLASPGLRGSHSHALREPPSEEET